METAFGRGEKSVLDWIKHHHADFAAGDLKTGLKEGNPSAASFMKFQAFSTAAVQDQRIRTRIQAALAGNLKRGEGARPFREVIASEFDKAGLSRLHPSQIENIYRTNTSLAYGGGQMQKLVQVSGDFPYWKYSATMDSKTRPDHAALHGKIFRTGDFTFWPPIGFRCRCTGIPLTARQAARYLKSAMPTAAQRKQLLENTGNAEFLGHKQKNYMKWLGNEYKKADNHTRTLIDQAFDTMKKEISSLEKEGLKDFFSKDFINKTWDKFRDSEAYIIAAQANKMSTSQAYYVHAYTLEAPLYKELNGWLFREIPPVDFSRSNLLTMKRKLTGSLKKLPKYDGIAWRYMPELDANTLKQYKKGNTIVWDGFSSASTKHNLDGFSEMPYTFMIHSKSSRKIDRLSAVIEEKETLFLPGSKFKILDRQKQGDKLFFELMEL